MSLVPLYQLHCNSWLKNDGRNQEIHLFKVLYCKWLTNSKQLPAFHFDVELGLKLQSQGLDVSVFLLCTITLNI